MSAKYLTHEYHSYSDYDSDIFSNFYLLAYCEENPIFKVTLLREMLEEMQILSKWSPLLLQNKTLKEILFNREICLEMACS